MRALFSIAFMALFIMVVAGGCSKKKIIAEQASPAAGGLAFDCVPLGAGKIKWTIENCGPLLNGETVLITQETIGYSPSGSSYALQALGSRSLDKGRVTFTITNLDYTDLPWPTNDIVLAVFMGMGSGSEEINWHILGNRFATWGWVQTRLVSQRFDGICIPVAERYCEKKDEDYDMPAYDRNKVFRFDCAWDTTKASLLYDRGPGVLDGEVVCGVYDVTDPKRETLVRDYHVSTSGPYPQLRYFLAGGDSGRQFRMKATPIKMTNFRFTILAD